jgi:hypothetical protein
VTEDPQATSPEPDARLFFPAAPDAVRMCLGPCADAKPVTAFPIVRGKPGARHAECRACRYQRTSRAASVAPNLDVNSGMHLPPRGRREILRRQRQAVAESVLEVMMAHIGVAVTITQVYEEVFDRIDFVPAEMDVRESLLALSKTDDRCVKVARDVYAWSTDGILPPPPAPPHVADMIERRWRGETLDEIGTAHGVTRERIRQLLKKHGGPTAKEIRDIRAAEALTAQRDHETAVAAQIRAALDGRGPMTVAEVVEATDIGSVDVSKYWPADLSHLRLWGASQVESRWSDEDILAALREASTYEFPLTTTAYSDLLQVGQVEGASVPRIGQRFGSWSAACAAAGVVAGDPWNRDYESRWSDDDLLQIARRYLLDPDSPSSAHRFDEWKRAFAPDGPSFQTLRNRLGSWNEVKRRALAQGDMET